MKQISLVLPPPFVNTAFLLRYLASGRRTLTKEGLPSLQSYARVRNPEVDALEEQIRVLKNIVAKQSIELEFKTELLKKSQSLEQRRSR